MDFDSFLRTELFTMLSAVKFSVFVVAGISHLSCVFIA